MIEVETYDLQRMILLLDAADDALTAAATTENRKEAGKPMRCITAQQRAKATRELVTELAVKYNVEL